MSRGSEGEMKSRGSGGGDEVEGEWWGGGMTSRGSGGGDEAEGEW